MEPLSLGEGRGEGLLSLVGCAGITHACDAFGFLVWRHPDGAISVEGLHQVEVLFTFLERFECPQVSPYGCAVIDICMGKYDGNEQVLQISSPLRMRRNCLFRFAQIRDGPRQIRIVYDVELADRPCLPGFSIRRIVGVVGERLNRFH